MQEVVLNVGNMNGEAGVLYSSFQCVCHYFGTALLQGKECSGRCHYFVWSCHFILLSFLSSSWCSLSGLPFLSFHFHLLLLLALARSHSLAPPTATPALGDNIRQPARVLPRCGLEVVHQELEPVAPLLPVLRLPQRWVVVLDAARRGRRHTRGAERAVRDLMPLTVQGLWGQEQVAADRLAGLGETLLAQVRGGRGGGVAEGRDDRAVAGADRGKDCGAIAVRFFAE